MGKKVIVVVDVQNDFVKGGALPYGYPENDIVSKICDYVRKESAAGNFIIATRDTHHDNYLETLEGKNLPVKHCIINTRGWEIHRDVTPTSDDFMTHKFTFGKMELGKIIDDYSESIDLVGLCTDICVISNAMILKATFPEIPIIVDASCCAGVTPESHKNALEAMKMCQIEIVGE
jgi:nicotinamidase-related amidase